MSQNHRVAAVPPPADIDSEAAVLSAVMLSASALEAVRGTLEPRHFYVENHRIIFSAVRELVMDGEPVDTVTVATRLRDRGRLEKIGGTSFIADLVDKTPAIDHVEAHAQTVIEKAHLRNTITVLEAAAVELRNGVTTEEEAFARIGQLGMESSREPRLQTIGVAEIFDVLPPVPYLLRALDICPGAPTLFAGLGFSGKNLLAHALGLAVACGAPAWGSLTTRTGKVLVLDYEQGAHLTRRRIQRMARGMGLIPDDGSLEISCMPALYADDPDAETELRAACQGVTLCIIDSLSAACPSLEENSASARRTLDMLGRVSEATGCVIIVIHHAKKPSKDDVGGARNSIRGSGALFDAAGCVVVFARRDDGSIELKHEKARTSGVLAGKMIARISDTPDGDLEVEVSTVSQEVGAGSARAPDGREAMDSAVYEYVVAHPGCTGRQIRAEVTGSDKAISDAILRLDMRGQIHAVDGPRRAQLWFTTTAERRQ